MKKDIFVSHGTITHSINKSCKFCKKLKQDFDNTFAFLRESNAIEDVWDDDSLCQALFAWAYLINQKKLTREVILETHKILMKNQDLDKSEKGHFRKINVRVGNKIMPDWQVVGFRLDYFLERLAFIDDVSYPKEELEEMAKSLHIQYEGIHPFVDGNGRTGRMFYNWWRVKKGLPIHIIYEKDKFDYYEWFRG